MVLGISSRPSSDSYYYFFFTVGLSLTWLGGWVGLGRNPKCSLLHVVGSDWSLGIGRVSKELHNYELGPNAHFLPEPTPFPQGLARKGLNSDCEYIALTLHHNTCLRTQQERKARRSCHNLCFAVLGENIETSGQGLKQKILYD